IEEAFDVRIARRGDSFSIEGTAAGAKRAQAALEHFWAMSDNPLSLDDIQLGLVERRGPARGPAKSEVGAPDDHDEASPILHTRRTDLQGRTPCQREYLRKILSHDITFGIGPAGTGKTYLA